MTLCSRSTFQLIFSVVCEHRTRIIYLELNAFIYCVELFQIQSDFLHLVAGSRFKHDCVLKTYLQRIVFSFVPKLLTSHQHEKNSFSSCCRLPSTTLVVLRIILILPVILLHLRIFLSIAWRKRQRIAFSCRSGTCHGCRTVLSRT